MPNPTPRIRGAGSPARRTIPAAARAAAKRAGRPERPNPNPTVDRPEDEPKDRRADGSGPTVMSEPLAGRDDPPEPVLTSDAPAVESGAAESGPARWPGRYLGTAVLGVLLLAGLAAVAVLGWRYEQSRRTDQAREEALTAARKAAPVVLSYDYRHLDRDFPRARALLTGSFRDEYGKTTRTVVEPTAKKYHGVVKATVAAPADGGAPAVSVVSAAPEKVVVLLFVNQTTRSTQVSGPRLDLNRVRMTLTRTPGGWKVSKLDAL
ncbi:hypothetical protein [Streptomyces sp. V3I7]|uniref:hypothetical protein n=1 Tax=Streptomyces sp. V3I7 TaxID=3042278 RepID=UPI002783E66A|nr:hypothetical protein [Streptomyces sp. V3I7]MDQ0993770.1 Mce-associated membrane protein [Streptomyces sp. V3I7]